MIRQGDFRAEELGNYSLCSDCFEAFLSTDFLLHLKVTKIAKKEVS